MKLLIDHADINIIKELYKIYPIDGVTTNPSILARTKRKPFEVLKEIREFLPDGAQLHVQVVSTNADKMIEEAHIIQKTLGKDTFIKIPVIPEGLVAIKKLKDEGANVTGTIVLSPMQGYLAAKAGADYIAPYVNRMDNYGYNGVKIAKELQDMLHNNNFKCSLLGASFKNSQQLLELAQHGVGACTAAPDIINNLLCFPPVTIQVEKFITDFEEICGAGHTLIEEAKY